MFRNSLEMGGGGIACLGPTAMIVRTIYMSESSSGASLDDPWVFAGPIMLYSEKLLYSPKLCLYERTTPL